MKKIIQSFLILISLLSSSFFVTADPDNTISNMHFEFTPFYNYWFLKPGERYMAKCLNIAHAKSKYPMLEYRHLVEDIYSITIPENLDNLLLAQLKNGDDIIFEQNRPIFPPVLLPGNVWY